MKTTFDWIKTQNDHRITSSTDSEFILLIQHAALLGLKDSGSLNEMQFRRAEERLMQKHREYIKSLYSDTDLNNLK